MTFVSFVTFKERNSERNLVGFSLVEVLIAFSILVVSILGMFQVFQRTGTQQKAFTSGHFTAMFLAQKVIEDINLRLGENPYYFAELAQMASSMQSERVVDGENVFFRLIDSPEGSSKLTPEKAKPITEAFGHGYDQLQKFKIRIKSEFVPDENRPGESYSDLLEVTIDILWNENDGKENQYTISYLFHGENTDQLKSGISSEVLNVPESVAVAALLDFLGITNIPSAGMPQLLSANGGGNEGVLFALGSMLAIINTINRNTEDIEAKIQNLTARIDQADKSLAGRIKFSSLKEQICGLWERLAGRNLQYIRMLEPHSAVLAGTDINETTFGPRLHAKSLDLAMKFGESMSILEDVTTSLEQAEKAWTELMTDSSLPGRRRNRVIRKWVELRKISILLLDFDNDSFDITPMVLETRDYLSKFQNQIRGHFPAFEDYLATEIGIHTNRQNFRNEYNALKPELKKISDTVKNFETFAVSFSATLTTQERK